PLRHRVETRSVLGEIFVPLAAVPKLQMIADADQHHFLIQPRETGEPFRHEDAARLVEVGRLHLSEEQPAKTSDLRVGRRSVADLAGAPFQILLGEDPQTLIRPRRQVELLDGSELVPYALRQDEPTLVVERSWMSSGEEHGRFAVWPGV